jgi:hypothetical protein
MTTDLDVTRIVRLWLRTDEHDSAERVLDNVLGLLDATPQRRPWWSARRNTHMNAIAKFALGAAAVVVAAVLAINLMPYSRNLGPGAATTSPSLAATASPSASESAPPIPPAGPLDTGRRHSFTLEGVPFTLTVPTGDWVSNGEFGMGKSVGVGPEGAGFIFWKDDANGIFSDPCGQVKMPEVGPSAGALAMAITRIPGIKLVRSPSDITVGGRPAWFVAIRIPENIPCDAQQFYLWYDSNDPSQARFATATGSTIRVWIIDVDGVRVQIDAETYMGAGPEPAQEIQQIIDSIRFE